MIDRARHLWLKVREPRFVSVAMFAGYLILTVGGIAAIPAPAEDAQ